MEDDRNEKSKSGREKTEKGSNKELGDKDNKARKPSERNITRAHKRNKPAHLKSSQDQVIHDMDEMLIKEHAAIKEANADAMHETNLKGVNRIKATAKEYMFAVVAVIIGSLSTVSVMIPNGLTVGGVSGIARIIQHYTEWNYSLTYYAFCLVIMLVVWVKLGIKELRKIIFMSLAYPLVMLLLETNNIVIIKSDDLLLVSIFCGVLFGICNALSFKAGFSSGGADSLAKVIKYRYMPHLGINDITFAINAVVVLASTFVFGIDIGLYAVIITYTSMTVGEAVMYGLSGKIVELEIISNHPKELAEFVTKELGRGVSGIEVTGEYTGEKRKELKVLCSPRESFLIKRYLVHHDPHSFVSVTSVKSVWGMGRGFSSIDKIEE